MYGYIYLTTNLINGKIYVGQHKVDNDLFDENYKGSGKLLTKEFKRIGRDKFKTTLLEWCSSQKELDEKEIFWINHYNLPNLEIGYNLTIGGQERFFTGQKHTEQSKIKMSNRAKLREHLPTTLGRIYINNGSINKCIVKDNLNYYLDNGWVIGKIFKNKPIAWNKGLTKETDKRVKKYIDNKAKNYDNGKFFREHNPRHKSDCELIEIYSNNGFVEYFYENGRYKTHKEYHMRLETVDRILKLLNVEETREHKLYIIRKGRKNK